MSDPRDAAAVPMAPMAPPPEPGAASGPDRPGSHRAPDSDGSGSHRAADPPDGPSSHRAPETPDVPEVRDTPAVPAGPGRPGSHRAPPPRRRRGPWIAVAVILLVMVALTAGWSALAAGLDDRAPVPSGTVLRLGPGDGPALVKITGTGWWLSKSSSDPVRIYSLHLGTVTLSATYVTLVSTADARNVFRGADKIMAMTGGDVGPAERTRTASGNPGTTGDLTREGKTGRLTTYVAPDASFAVQFVLLAPPEASPSDRAAAQGVVRDLAFAASAS